MSGVKMGTFALLVLLSIFSLGESSHPIGDTGCTYKYEGGTCWRYCEGSSGAWCYTSKRCINLEEQCTSQNQCSGLSCDWATKGCVTKCPEPAQASEEPTTEWDWTSPVVSSKNTSTSGA